MSDISAELEDFGRNTAMERCIKFCVGIGELAVGSFLVPVGLGLFAVGTSSPYSPELVYTGVILVGAGMVGVTAGADDVTDSFEAWRDDWSD